MRARLLGAAFLVAAALLNLPIVYKLVADDATAPPFALAFGFLAMGLAWAAGFHIEAKRRWFVILASVAGVAEAFLVFAPIEGDGMSVYMIAAGVLSAGALGLFVLRRPTSE